MPKLAIASILGEYERILGAEHGLILLQTKLVLSL